MKKTIRDAVTGDLTLDYFARRSAEGWKIASIEWVREVAETELPVAAPDLFAEPAVPYGLQVAQEGLHLQENPLEATVLLLILEQIVKEKRISEIASELNQQGYATRAGTPWNATEVFNLLPRLIEAGPSLLKSAAWQQRRQTSSKPH